MPMSTRRRALRKILSSFAAPVLLATTSGCGTILHPERKGQPAGRIDWKIAALDGLGLILFFIPGVIAFAVDFNNGTIYLPPGSTASAPSAGDLRAVSCGTRCPAYSDIERVLREEANVTVQLRDHRVRRHALSSIKEFRAARAGLMQSGPEASRQLQHVTETSR